MQALTTVRPSFVSAAAIVAKAASHLARAFPRQTGTTAADPCRQVATASVHFFSDAAFLPTNPFAALLSALAHATASLAAADASPGRGVGTGVSAGAGRGIPATTKIPTARTTTSRRMASTRMTEVTFRACERRCRRQ